MCVLLVSSIFYFVDFWIVDGERGIVKEKGVELISPRKRGLVTDDVIICKRMRSQCSRLDASLEAKLKSMSGKVYEAHSKPLVEEGIAKKKDNAPVPVELWLYWLNAGLDYSFSLEELLHLNFIIQKCIILV